VTAIIFKNAKYVKTALLPKDYPTMRDLSGNILPEIAVAGRSNVGKSSLLNHLFVSKGLVKTSSVPGKTQALNFFTVDDKLAFVDLPGYGYAQVPIKVRKQWGPMIQRYLETRETLKLILFLFDIRRIPNEEDKQLIEWAAYHQKPLILVLTKVDKVTQNEKRSNTQKILHAFDADSLHYVHYSTTKNVGRNELIHKLMDALTA
jgi:GTP-binding protein